MGRIILLIIIGFLIYLVLRGFFRSQLKKPDDEAKPPANAEDMVRCQRCGVNLPRSEAVEQDGKLVCRENPNCK
ncbi:PP0621 family protein [Usitatibacter palustris]|uniref:Uncharacterized protein n=1 Tax=Usitatibacter palustris TaxID=2732487 RepID=A0A6M4H9T4_9PROT|nr:PP0621 family protein [Usitatibacter palustris]QJR15945.1 hypothetical protein DSM104440_02772 [Usitatibacter palustris]